jgi:hypothetical protein
MSQQPVTLPDVRQNTAARAATSPSSPRAPTTSGDGGGLCANPVPRIGIHNPNSLNPTSTVIGLGTVGLGERCRKERKLLHKQNFARWCEEKQKEEYQKRLAEGGSTPKKPMTAKEAYIARKNAHLVMAEKLLDQQAESARRFREAAQTLKAQFHKARQDDHEFCRDYITEAKDEESRRYARAYKAQREKEREEQLSARQKVIKEQFAEEQATFEELVKAEEDETKARIEYDHMIATTIDKKALEAQKRKVEDKHAIVKKIKDHLNHKKKLRVNLEKDRLAEYKQLVKTTKVELRDKVENSVNKLLEQRIVNAEQMRDARTRAQSQSPRSAATNNNNAKRGSQLIPTMPTSPGGSSVDVRRQHRTEHHEIIEQSSARRRDNAEVFRQERSQQLTISAKDKEQEDLYRKELHDYVREMKMQSLSAIASFQEAKLASVRSQKPHREGGGSPAAAAAAVRAEEAES